MKPTQPTILFDKDGTLIDTEKHYHTAWLEGFKAYGHPITVEQALKFRSLGTPFAEEYLKELVGPDADWQEIRRLRDLTFLPLLEKYGIELKPYCKETLSYLKEQGYRMAIVTATTLERAAVDLEKSGLREYFDEVISARTVKRGKPAPDVYLYACEVLGIDPKETIAVEDSPNGVESAWGAGCKVFMIPDQTQPDERIRAMCYRCCENLKEFAEELNR